VVNRIITSSTTLKLLIDFMIIYGLSHYDRIRSLTMLPYLKNKLADNRQPSSSVIDIH